MKWTRKFAYRGESPEACKLSMDFAATTSLNKSGYYYLTNVNSNKVLEVKDQSTANGAAVDQWSNNGGNHQKWEINDLGNGYYKILNENGGKALDVKTALQLQTGLQ